MKNALQAILLALGTASFSNVSAQEPVPPPAPPQQQGEDKIRIIEKPEPRDKDRPRHRDEVPHREMRPSTYLGIATRSPSPEARAMTGVAEGFGLVIEEVLPESPAAAAGLQRYDLITQLNDQLLVNAEQLSALVRHQAKDTQITLTLKRAGAEQKVTVKLVEKMIPVHQGHGPISQYFGETFNREDMRKFGDELRDNIHRFSREMDQWREGMKNVYPKKDKPARPHSGEPKRDEPRDDAT
jgi:membrane-associated protease RseP (regulator of RpoE activity)